MGYDPSLMAPVVMDGFSRGFANGQEARKQNITRAALAALVKDPNNANALAALAQVDPATAMEFRKQQAETQKQQLAQHQDSILKGAEIIRQFQPKDQASYTQALVAAQHAGIDISQVPQQYDPAYVDGIVRIADTFKPQNENGSQVVVTPQPNSPAFIYDKSTGQTKQIVFTDGQAPPPLTDDQMRQMLNGGAGGNASGGFPVGPAQ